MKKKLYYIYLVILTALVAGCQDEAMFTADSDDGLVTVSYRVKVGDDLQSRAIGDGTTVNNLTILVLDDEGDEVLRKDLGWPISEDDAPELNLTLLRGEYKVLFWLQYIDEETDFQPYLIDEGQVTVSYGDTWTGNIADMENWDAFYATDVLTIDSEAKTKPITLTRPLGQLNWVDEKLQLVEGDVATVTLNGVATTFHPFGQNQATEVSANTITFNFSGYVQQTFAENGSSYSCLSCNYLLPATLNASFTLKRGEENLIQKENVSITIETNQRTNVLTSTELATDESENETEGEDDSTTGNEGVITPPEGGDANSGTEGATTTPEGENTNSGTEGNTIPPEGGNINSGTEGNTTESGGNNTTGNNGISTGENTTGTINEKK